METGGAASAFADVETPSNGAHCDITGKWPWSAATGADFFVARDGRPMIMQWRGRRVWRSTLRMTTSSWYRPRGLGRQKHGISLNSAAICGGARLKVEILFTWAGVVAISFFRPIFFHFFIFTFCFFFLSGSMQDGQQSQGFALLPSPVLA